MEMYVNKTQSAIKASGDNKSFHGVGKGQVTVSFIYIPNIDYLAQTGHKIKYNIVPVMHYTAHSNLHQKVNH